MDEFVGYGEKVERLPAPESFCPGRLGVDGEVPGPSQAHTGFRATPPPPAQSAIAVKRQALLSHRQTFASLSRVARFVVPPLGCSVRRALLVGGASCGYHQGCAASLRLAAVRQASGLALQPRPRRRDRQAGGMPDRRKPEACATNMVVRHTPIPHRRILTLPPLSRYDPPAQLSCSNSHYDVSRHFVFHFVLHLVPHFDAFSGNC